MVLEVENEISYFGYHLLKRLYIPTIILKFLIIILPFFVFADNSVIQSEGTPGLIYGFGYTTNDRDFATTLQQGFKFIQLDSICSSQQNFPQLIRQMHTHFCARAGITISTDGNNICSGDQGGGFIANGFLVRQKSSNSFF